MLVSSAPHPASTTASKSLTVLHCCALAWTRRASNSHRLPIGLMSGMQASQQADESDVEELIFCRASRSDDCIVLLDCITSTLSTSLDFPIQNCRARRGLIFCLCPSNTCAHRHSHIESTSHPKISLSTSTYSYWSGRIEDDPSCVDPWAWVLLSWFASLELHPIQSFEARIPMFLDKVGLSNS